MLPNGGRGFTPQNLQHGGSGGVADCVSSQDQCSIYIAENIERQQMQQTIRNNDDILAVRFGRKFADKNGVEPLGCSVIVTSSLYAFEEPPYEVFDLLPSFGQYLNTFTDRKS